MISTITTTVITITNTILNDSLALLATLTLLALLVQKEIVYIARDTLSDRLNRALDIAILPLVFAFFAIIAVKLWSMF